MKQVTGLVQILAFVLIFATTQTQAQKIGFGKCPSNVKSVETFDLNAYLGRWYEYSKYPVIFEFNGKCIYAQYTLEDAKVKVYNHQIDRLTNMAKSINGTAGILSPGKLAVVFQNVPSFSGDANYWVLGTDYKTYSVVYSCADILGIFHGEIVWILTRERVPSAATIQTAKNIIEANGLSLQSLEQTDQQNCPANQ